MNTDRLIADIKDPRSGEGFSATVYADSRGFSSIGYGRNLVGQGITTDEADYLLRNDLKRIRGEMEQRLPWVLDLDDVRCRVFLELAYNMGMGGLLTFRKMLTAAHAEDWTTAHAELLDSAWRTQVQAARRDRIASMLLTGAEL